MNQTVDEFNRAKSKMASTLDKAMTEAEDLRKAAADVSGGAEAAPDKSDAMASARDAPDVKEAKAVETSSLADEKAAKADTKA